MDHREDSTFSFDPSVLNVKRLSRQKLKKIDARKGVLLSSYSRKKTRRRKRKSNSSNQKGEGVVSESGSKNENKDSASNKSSPKKKPRWIYVKLILNKLKLRFFVMVGLLHPVEVQVRGIVKIAVHQDHNSCLYHIQLKNMCS